VTIRERIPGDSSVAPGSATTFLRTLILVGLLSVASAIAARADDARPGPFVFVYGLQGPGAAETARSLGCNTIYFDLPRDAPMHLGEIRDSISEAREQGLQVIVGLRTKLDGSFPITASDEEYAGSCREWIASVVSGLAGTEGIDAWATDHYLERDITHSEDEFRAFLLDRHGSLEGINEAWGTEYRHLGEITRSRARALDENETYGVGRATVDVAEYERRAFHDVMALWADEVRRHDPDTTLMTGRISLYRSLTAIPTTYDVVQPFMPPDILERDLATHNVQAVQIGRRGGRFEVIPWLSVPVPPSEAYAQFGLSRWIMEAGLRGAIGVGLMDADRVGYSAAVRRNIVEQLSDALAARPFEPTPPEPCAAVLYEPYAGGHHFHGTPAWGYVEDFPSTDLAELAFNYRTGTVLGGLDYLCLEDLEDADLDRYSAILAPICLSVPPQQQEILRRYVERGGALFADLGFGVYEARYWNPAMGPMSALLGIAAAIEPAHRYGGFVVGELHPDFPSVQPGMEASGTFVPGQGENVSMGNIRRHSFLGAATEMQGYAFQGPSWYVNLLASAIPLATQNVRHDDEQRPYFLGVSVHQIGPGLALFAPFPAWSHWPPSDNLHAAIHGDLLARRASYRVIAPTFLGSEIGVSGSPDHLSLLSRGASGTVEILAAADHRAWLGAEATFSASSREPDGRRTGDALLAVNLPRGGMVHCRAVPLRIRPASGTAHAIVTEFGSGRIAFELGGTGASWGAERRDGPPRFYGGLATRIRISVEDGAYAIEPGSEHVVSVREGRESLSVTRAIADHRGVLDFWLTVAGGTVTITPAGG